MQVLKMKIIIKVSSGGEFKDIEFVGEPTEVQVEIVEVE
jgi:hypothetical protein